MLSDAEKLQTRNHRLEKRLDESSNKSFIARTLLSLLLEK